MWWLLACSEYDVNGKKEQPAAGDPQIEVSPLELDFGTTVPGTTLSGAVDIRNVGDSQLTLETPKLADPSGVFAMENLETSTLEPEQQTRLPLSFSPTTAESSSGTLAIYSDDPDTPRVDVILTGSGLPPALTIAPLAYDFGSLEPSTSATVDILLSSSGSSDLHLSGLRYEGSEMSLVDDGSNGCGPLPWTLPPGSSCTVRVGYSPTDTTADEGRLYVTSDDPSQPESIATQVGNAKPFVGFSTGWYIVDDQTMYDTTSNPSYIVDYHGELDGYWYEPSGAHGMIGSVDIPGDFAILRNYILARAGSPTPVSGPLNFDSASSVPALTSASYSWILCDFWLDPTDDPARYSISSGSVDDGLLVIVNGQILGNILLGQTGNWPLSGAIPGQVNSLVLILMDNAQVNKYAHDLAFYKDGVMVH